MTEPLQSPRFERRTVRELLIEQQRTESPDLALPPLLRTPAIIVLWLLVLSTVVGALALGRVRVPRVARGVVVIERWGMDSLTPVLLLPSSAGRYLSAGRIAAVDTGGKARLELTITAVRRKSPTADTSTIAVALERCRDGHCLPHSLSGEGRYPATATLGTRSLASFALPGS
ncbi:MAG TPA: hypothetical protein VM076_04090 [Gemmatimonadaceae bacterium]|nr:hypothetical protein [Gemmatimonadaceae bacterium]